MLTPMFDSLSGVKRVASVLLSSPANSCTMLVVLRLVVAWAMSWNWYKCHEIITWLYCFRHASRFQFNFYHTYMITISDFAEFSLNNSANRKCRLVFSLCAINSASSGFPWVIPSSIWLNSDLVESLAFFVTSGIMVTSE